MSVERLICGMVLPMAPISVHLTSSPVATLYHRGGWGGILCMEFLKILTKFSCELKENKNFARE